MNLHQETSKEFQQNKREKETSCKINKYKVPEKYI